MTKLFACFLLLLFHVCSGLASTQPLKSGNVYVGIYPNRIYDIKIKDDSYSVDFTIWFRWKDSRKDPSQTFKVRNGKVENQKVAWKGKIPETGMNLAIIDITANFSKKWDVSNYPFDRQQIEIQIEENEDEVDQIVYIPDSDNMSEKHIDGVPGWDVEDIHWKVTTFNYDTNYGYISNKIDKTTTTSGFEYFIDLKKEGFLSEFKLLISPLVILALLYFGRFLKISSNDTDRVNLGITSLFAAIAVHFIITQDLPESNDFSVLEWVVVLTIFAAGWYSALTFIAVHYLKEDKSPAKLALIEKINFRGIALIVIFVVCIILRAIFSPAP